MYTIIILALVRFLSHGEAWCLTTGAAPRETCCHDLLLPGIPLTSALTSKNTNHDGEQSPEHQGMQRIHAVPEDPLPQ